MAKIPSKPSDWMCYIRINLSHETSISPIEREREKASSAVLPPFSKMDAMGLWSKNCSLRPSLGGRSCLFTCSVRRLLRGRQLVRVAVHTNLKQDGKWRLEGSKLQLNQVVMQ